ncbi:MAG: PQQ-like beta-propeller repeat protein [Planctomycetia bacterium]|nr:PQQ-like beta-propeller repeat protein [Planctomycetia bacterium]
MTLRVPLLACAFLIVATAPAADWPQWRGPARTAISNETGLLKTWPKDGPPRVYTVKGLGGGYGSPIVVGGKIYGVGKIDGKECLWCLNEKDGSEMWKKEFAAGSVRNYGEGPRCTPTYHVDPKAGAVIYATGVSGDLACLKADTGEKVWSKNFGKDFGGRMMSGWGYSESPLVDGGKLICTPGADKAAIVALNTSTGETIWKAEIPKCGGSGYSSPVKAKVGDVSMYITVMGRSGGVVAVNAETGKLLWQYTKIANGTANIPTVIVRDDLVWCSTGYRDGGSALLQMTAGDDTVTVKELKYYDQKLQNHHGGMVLVGDYVYFGANHGQGYPACVEFKTGEMKYKEEKPAGGGGGSAAIAFADGMLYYRYQNGQVVLLEANPEEVKVAGSFKLPELSGKAQWAHPVIANGKLYIRDQDKLHVYNIKAAGN